MNHDPRNHGRQTASVSRRALLCAPLLSPLALAASSFAQAEQPNGVKRLRITKVHTVEVRGVPAGKGLVLPWDAKKMPQDTRDYGRALTMAKELEQMSVYWLEEPLNRDATVAGKEKTDERTTKH